MRYFDTNMNLSKEDILIRRSAREFAQDVMRPVSRELDAMTAEQVVAPDSPLWGFLKQAYELEFHTIMLPEYYGGQGLSPLQLHMIFEEFGWASFGLSVQMAVVCFPFYIACMTGDEELIETFVKPFCECRDGSIRGCWAITEPDHGSDILAIGEECFYSEKMRGNVQAVLDGDEWVINGQKSSWVSGGTIATHALLHPQIDSSQGLAGGGVCFVPLDRKGVSRGKPLEKIGQRDLNQGEIFFDNVRIPKQWMMVEPDFYVPLTRYDSGLSQPVHVLLVHRFGQGHLRRSHDVCQTENPRRQTLDRALCYETADIRVVCPDRVLSGHFPHRY